MQALKEKGFWRRTAVMLAGVVFLGLGIGLLQKSMMGNDPSSAHIMAIADKIGISFANLRLCVNVLWAIPELLFGRKYIGIGTFANWFFVGHIATFFETRLLSLISVPDIFIVKFALMILSVLVLSFGIALYQTPDVGVAPYDALAILLHDYTDAAQRACGRDHQFLVFLRCVIGRVRITNTFQQSLVQTLHQILFIHILII